MDVNIAGQFVPFSLIKPGGVFEYEHTACIKLDVRGIVGANTVCLSTGTTTTVPDKHPVKPLRTEKGGIVLYAE